RGTPILSGGYVCSPWRRQGFFDSPSSWSGGASLPVKFAKALAGSRRQFPLFAPGIEAVINQLPRQKPKHQARGSACQTIQPVSAQHGAREFHAPALRSWQCPVIGNLVTKDVKLLVQIDL